MTSRKPSLAETHPELAAQAVGWDTKLVSEGSHKKLAWKCTIGHRWDAVVASRALNGRGCPVCKNKKILEGYNDLATTHPDLAAQADGWNPTTVSAGSSKKFRWVCEVGHQWFAAVSHRTSRAQGCPYCSGNLVIVGETDLATTHPELAAQADGWNPTTVKAGGGAKLAWKGACGHKWTAVISSRALNAAGCSICANLKILVGLNDLATTHPELAAQADGWDPTTAVAGSNKQQNWKCEFDHKWKIEVVARTSSQRGCPICANQKVLVGFNDLKTTHPELAAQADGWDPTTKIAGSSNEKVGWRCELGHKWFTTVSHRTSRSQGCPTCSGRIVLKGFNDLATISPELAAEADGWDPTTVTNNSGKQFSWRCKLGHKWKAPVNSRSRGSGCPYCANKEVLVGFNDLKTTHHELATQADGWDPKTVVAGAGKKLDWKGTCGHRWRAVVVSRAHGGNGCPICHNLQLLVGFNDLATKRPDLAQQAVGWDPKSVIAGNNSKKRWRCDNGHEWLATTSKRMSGRGCPSCAQTGFDPNQPGYLYLIDHFELDMFQIGITSHLEERLGSHERGGWEVIELRGPMDGHLTQKLETDCLHTLEKRGAILGHKAGIEKFDGYSEAWTKASLNVTSIKQILDWVYEDETVAK